MPQMGVPLGMVLATLAMTLMSTLPDAAFLAWGWRVPFLMSSVLVLLGLWIRRGIEETPEFERAQKQGRVEQAPIVVTLRHHWRAVLVATGAKVVETAPFYVFTTFVVSYASGSLTYTRVTVLNAITLAAVVTCVAIPFMGLLADRFGSRLVYMGGAVLMAAFAGPYFMLLDIGTAWAIVLATVVSVGIIWAPIVATLGSIMAQIFSTEVRYTGITLGSQIGAAFAGGTAPLIATWLLRQSGGSWTPIAIYIAICAGISFVSVAQGVRVHRTRSIVR